MGRGDTFADTWNSRTRTRRNGLPRPMSSSQIVSLSLRTGARGGCTELTFLIVRCARSPQGPRPVVYGNGKGCWREVAGSSFAGPRRFQGPSGIGQAQAHPRIDRLQKDGQLPRIPNIP